MTGDLAVVAHHKTRMSSGRKHVQSQTFPFGNRGSAGVILVVGHALDERPEISLNLRHFLRPNSLAQINILHPGRRAGNEKSGQRAKNEIHSGGLPGGTLRPGARRPRRFCVDGNACTPSCSSAWKSLSCRPSIFCLSRPPACPTGCRSCEFHASLAPIVGKWIDGF
jgi:hypothetical protein